MLQEKGNAVTLGTQSVGFFLLLSDPSSAEALATTGPDFLVIDMEASDMSRRDVVGMLRALPTTRTIVRMRDHGRSEIEHVLDQGANGIMVPKVQSAEDARAVVAASKYSPVGVRGVNPVRASGYFSNISNYLSTANSTTQVWLQIETAVAVEAADEIARVSGVTGLFIGSGDLAMDLGRPGDPHGPEFDAARGRVLEQCAIAGVSSGIFAYSVQDALLYLDEGFEMIAIANDIKLLLGGAASILSSVRY